MGEIRRAAGREPRRFEAALYRVGQLRCVDVPPAAVAALGGGARIPVRVSLGGREDQSALVPKRGGGHRLFLSAPLRQAAGVDTGDRVEVEVRPDAQGGEPELPEELVAALGRIAGGMEALLTRSPADRRQLVRWIDAPKSSAARSRRVIKAVEMVLRGPPKKKR